MEKGHEIRHVKYEESVQIWVTTVAKELATYELDLAGVQTVKTGGKTICSEIHDLFRLRRNNLRSGGSRSLYVFITRVIKQTVVIIEAYHFCQQRTKFYSKFFCQG
jgi:hypothetical protein